ncbi:histidine kinase [bacterium SCSIO 12741]|nr:histidine kinase [bacterium SCSIO 12741]
MVTSFFKNLASFGLLLGIALTLPNSVTAQQPVPPIIFPLTEYEAQFSVYDLVVDHHGYTYSYGPIITRFDGVEGKLIRHENPKTRGAFYRGFKDYNGKPWGWSRDGEIVYIKDDVIYEYPVSEEVKKLFRRVMEKVYFDSLGTLYFSPRFVGMYSLTAEGNLEQQVKMHDKFRGYIVSELPDGSVMQSSCANVVTKGELMELWFRNSAGEMTKIADLNDKGPHFGSSLIDHQNGMYTIAVGTRSILQFTKDSLIRSIRFPHKVLKLFLDSRKNMWIGTASQGMFRTNERLEGFTQIYKGALAVEDESEDGTLWVKSGDKGLGYIVNPQIDHYSSQNDHPEMELTTMMHEVNDTVYELNKRSVIHKFYSDTIIQIQRPPFPKELRDSTPKTVFYDTNSGLLWVGYRGYIYSWDRSKWKGYKVPNKDGTNARVIQFVSSDSGQLFVATFSKIFEFRNDSLKFITQKFGNKKRYSILSIFRDDQGRFWVGCEDGLWIYENEQWTPFSAPGYPENKQPVWFVFQALNRLWIQTGISGDLLYLEKDSVHVMTNSSGEPFAINGWGMRGNQLWLRLPTRNALVQVQDSVGSLRTRDYFQPGVAFRAVIDKAFTITSDKIYNTSDIGVVVFPFSELHTSMPEQSPFIRESQVNYTAVPQTELTQLKYDENSIQLFVDQITLAVIKPEFRYRLMGYDTVWRQSYNGIINFTNLPSGSFEFQFQSRLNRNVFWAKPETLAIEIAPPFWESWWFRVSAFLTFLGGLYFLFSIRERQIRAKERERTQVAVEVSRLELRALKAQLNPHFIFNSLSSVQFYLAKNQPQDAQSYLHKFSMLMRRVLENSESNQVSLAEELSLMEQYIELESERFDGEKIQFKTTIAELDPQDIWIPPALFQPYVENAIWHGLRPKKGTRSIEIRVKRAGGLLKLEIEDNGIGRDAAQAQSNKANSKRSFGMMIASRRIKIMNQNKGLPIEIVDLMNMENQPVGTLVRIELPFQTKKNDSTDS